MNEEKIIDIIHNSPTVDSFYKLFINLTSCVQLVMAWNISDLWYVPGVYHANQLHTQGWYTFNVISFLYNLDITGYNTLEFDHVTIYYKGHTLNKIQLFCIESFAIKLRNIFVQTKLVERQDFLIDLFARTIKDPLCTILRGSAEASDNIDSIKLATTKLADGVFNYIDLKKLEIDRFKPERSLFNLYELLSEFVEYAHGHKIDILYYAENRVPEYIYSDKSRLKQILITILKNYIVRKKSESTLVLYITSDMINLAAEEEADSFNYLYMADHQYDICFTLRDTGSNVENMDIFKPAEVTHSENIDMRIIYLLSKQLDGTLTLTSNEEFTEYKLHLITIDFEPGNFTQWALKELKGKKVLLIGKHTVQLLNFFDKYQMIYTLATDVDEVRLLHADTNYDAVITQDIDVKDITVKDKIISYIDITSKNFKEKILATILGS